MSLLPSLKRICTHKLKWNQQLATCSPRIPCQTFLFSTDSSNNTFQITKENNDVKSADAASSEQYGVFRLDDNSHKFEIKRFETYGEAQEFMKYMERTKHKQTYEIKRIE